MGALTIYEQLKRLMVALQAGQSAPPDVAADLLPGLQRYVSGSGHESLGTCLGLEGPGIDSIATLQRRRRRDWALARVMESIQRSEPGLTPTEAAKRLRAHVNRFQRKWARLSHHPCPLGSLDVLDGNLYRAFKANDGRVPKSIPQLLACASKGKKK